MPESAAHSKCHSNPITNPAPHVHHPPCLLNRGQMRCDSNDIPHNSRSPKNSTQQTGDAPNQYPGTSNSTQKGAVAPAEGWPELYVQPAPRARLRAYVW